MTYHEFAYKYLPYANFFVNKINLLDVRYEIKQFGMYIGT